MQQQYRVKLVQKWTIFKMVLFSVATLQRLTTNELEYLRKNELELQKTLELRLSGKNINLEQFEYWIF